MELLKNQHLLSFDDFGKTFDFLPIFRFFGIICRFLKSWETENSKKLFSSGKITSEFRREIKKIAGYPITKIKI